MLLRQIGETDPSTLEDLILIMAKNVERALIEGGAVPGEDYTILDLYGFARPFALEVFKTKDITYAAAHF